MSITSFPIETKALASEPLGSIQRNTSLFGLNPATGAIERYSQSSLAPVFSVTHYGAKGDGVTDDTAAIAACFAAATANSRILIPPGIYLVSSGLYLVNNGVTVEAHGATFKSATASVGKLYVQASGVNVYGLKLDGSCSGTGTPPPSWEGLMIITGISGPIGSIRVIDCEFTNSNSLGLEILGAVDGVLVQANRFSNNFIHYFAEVANGATYKNVISRGNKYGLNWYTATYSGCIKFKGNGGLSLNPTGLIFDGEELDSNSEMGIEMFDGINDSEIVSCNISGTTFGISMDNCENMSVVLNKCFRNSYCGIELADRTRHTLVKGNTISGYSSGTTRGPGRGVVSSGTSCYFNRVVGNTIRGCDNGTLMMDNHDIIIKDNHVYDCNVLIGVKNTSYVGISDNELFGPCTYHCFIDCNDKDSTNIAFTSNDLYGAASVDNVVVYAAPSGRVVSNVLIADNYTLSATCGNKPVNIALPGGSTPNLQVLDNRFIPHQGKSEFNEQATNPELVLPFRSPIQRSGISVAAKRSVTIAANGSPQWLKLFSADYGAPIYLQLHIDAVSVEASPAQNSMTAIITGAPYGFDAAVALLPAPNYYGGLVSEVIYNNHENGSVSEVWIKVPARSAPIKYDFYFSDFPQYVLVTPYSMATEPGWASNSYRAQVEAQKPTAMQARSFFARDEIISSAMGGVPTEGERGGRLHIRGAGTTSYYAQQRIARFDLANGTEVVGIDSAGLLSINNGLRTGNGWTITDIRTASWNMPYGSIGANSESFYSFSVGGAQVRSNPSAVFVGWASSLPTGIVLKQAYVSATDLVQIALRNNTASTVTVGTIQTTVTVFQY